PVHPELKIAMDMSIQLKVPSGVVCTLALSFNNNGPLGTWFRYICDNGTYVARYDELVDGFDKPIDVSKVDVSMDGIELQDREFIAAIERSEEHTSELQSPYDLVCRLLLEKKKYKKSNRLQYDRASSIRIHSHVLMI